MYSGPNISQPSGGGAAARTTLPVLGAILCGGLLLLLLAATIVLALIPIYLAQKTATLSSNSATSGLVTTYINTDNGNGRRRRQGSDDGVNIGNYAGGSFDGSSNTMVETQFMNLLLSSKRVSKLLQFACVVANINTKKRRYAFAKRATTTVIACSFYIQFISSCISTSCQTAASSTCSSLLVSGVTSNKFDFSNIVILNTDRSIWVTITRLRFIGLQSPPDIRPGKGAGSPTTRSTIPGTRTTATAPTPTSNVG
ncbi:unnamed protein product [Rotaria magnacalcarata]|uniref:Uncharacterized protein n=1 Tax=Rotaria magnacalcarata TaxID=392030 RepID=A0A815QDM8_9BILA|nr:unnamed protein product [Rotaria magnacalcarata]CAF1460712.1 unnamed protein product [Rotaria magnacalcarata]CAF2211575.1 unnamed protein product [Rotaria magnacalcarata]CAF3874977.1 unnamed protein product [Rotaria magnacalcarata]CAF3948228.1 unnamed protein product [Rotaria magnacalcarata]